MQGNTSQPCEAESGMIIDIRGTDMGRISVDVVLADNREVVSNEQVRQILLVLQPIKQADDLSLNRNI